MDERVHFSTSLRPHRSLSPLGFKWLIRVVILANLVIGRFLAPVERRQVAEQLEAALADMRTPNYAHDWD